jgi:hypothetical protein
MVEGTRPVDWVMLAIEFLVLVLICIEYGERKWKDHRRHKHLMELQGLLTEGQNIQTGVPGGQSKVEVCQAWDTSVRDWMNKTHMYLRDECSPQAVARFSVNTGGPAGVRYPFAALCVHGTYITLLERMDSLRVIIETPDSYL